MPQPTQHLTHALSVDIGGTFTDFSLLNLDTHEVMVHKVLTNPDAQSVLPWMSCSKSMSLQV